MSAKNAFLLIAILLATTFTLNVPATEDPETDVPPLRDPWVDSVMKTMSLDRQIAQLFMVRANLDGVYLEEVDSFVSELGVGGIVWFKSNPTELAGRTAALQAKSDIPLFVAIDAEYGLGMRIDSAWKFPRQMILGAINDLDLIRDMGSEIGRQCQSLGIHINFAPVVDINSNPDNPIINTRSFGEGVTSVAVRGKAYMEGLQSKGIIATAKHFPGHGDTDKDSHLTLPVIRHSKDTIMDMDTEPFRQLIEAGVEGVMTAHLQVPAIEPDSTIPFTLSENGVRKLLKKQLRFKGLTITDALEMKGVTSQFPTGEIAVRAFEAGNDILLMPDDVPVAINAMRKAVDEGRIAERDIRKTCRKILLAKSSHEMTLPLDARKTDWHRELNTAQCEVLTNRIYEEAVTLVLDRNGLVPMNPNPSKMYASLALNTSKTTAFQRTLEVYGPFDHYNLSANFEEWERDALFESLDYYETIFISIESLSNWPQRNYGMKENMIGLIAEIAASHQVFLTVFGNPYALNLLEGTDSLAGLIVGYDDGEAVQSAAAQVIAGALPAVGKLPVSTAGIPAGSGINTNALDVIRFTSPAASGIPEDIIKKVDEMALAGIEAGAYPSCQILVAKQGKVFYNKAFGYQTYDSVMPVAVTDIYDLASLTKITATTLAVMKLSEEGRIDIDKTLGEYLPLVRSSNKEGLIIRDVMTHQARLKPWIPFFQKLDKARKEGKPVIAEMQDDKHTIRLANGCYMARDYVDTLWNDILSSQLLRLREYKYSDLGFYLLKELVETVSGMPMDEYLAENFYRPLGMAHTAFKPAEFFCLDKIIPTEHDTLFRKAILKGDVHDPGAAMLGGIAGHAGLFSNSSDLAILMQMLVNGGEYGGKRYFREETVREFTRQQYPLNKNRRAIGFDKPDPLDREHGTASKRCSLNSFGHSGFTGTYVWADPDYDLVYVFLSNRTWPYGGPNMLAKMNIRTDILDVVYAWVCEQ